MVVIREDPAGQQEGDPKMDLTDLPPQSRGGGGGGGGGGRYLHLCPGFLGRTPPVPTPTRFYVT